MGSKSLLSSSSDVATTGSVGTGTGSGSAGPSRHMSIMLVIMVGQSTRGQRLESHDSKEQMTPSIIMIIGLVIGLLSQTGLLLNGPVFL